MSGYVYFVVGKSGEDLICKIGYTSRTAHARLNDLQPCSPVPLDIFGYVRGDVALEKKFHRTFEPLRIHGEWFVAEHKLKDFIYYLAGYGAANRLTTQEEMEDAVWDCILADRPPHPDAPAAAYMASADMSEWQHVEALFA